MQYSVAEAFGIQASSSITIEGGDAPSDYTPQVEPDYHFRSDILSDVLAWFKVGAKEGLYLTGPTGSGKSSIIRQVAARLNLPLHGITAHSRMEIPDMVGQFVIKDGTMNYVYGPLARAMRDGGLFLLDEIDTLEPSVLVGLNGIVEGDVLVISENGGEIIRRHPEFRFVATGNTNGGGNTGEYMGTNRMNIAFMDRFWVLNVPYPSEDVEMKIVSKAEPEIPIDLARKMICTANDLRMAYQQGNLPAPMSTRVLIRWMRLTNFFKALSRHGISPIRHALDRSYLNRFDAESVDAAVEIAQRSLGSEAMLNREDAR